MVRRLTPRPTPRDYRDGELRGLILTVLPSGKKAFSVRYRARGKQRRLVIGVYPALSLAAARKAARTALSRIDAGADPVAEHVAANAKRTDTVAALVADYLAHAAKFKRTADQDARTLTVEVLPAWGNRSVRDLTRRDVRALIEPIAGRAPIMGNRTLALVRRLFNYGIDTDWLDANPAARIAKPAPEVSRDRVLTDDEIRRLWRCLSNAPTTAQRPAPGRRRMTGTDDDPLCPVSPALAAVIKVRLLTAQRGGEVVKMKWADLELPPATDTTRGGWWTIPGTDTKNGQVHRVYLLPEAVALIRAQHPTRVEDRTEHVFVGRGGASTEDRAKKAPALLARALGVGYRGHDLRRTAATHMAAAGVRIDAISAVLNHLDGTPRATRVYVRHDRDAHKQAALEVWGRRLAAILADSATSGTLLHFGMGG